LIINKKDFLKMTSAIKYIDDKFESDYIPAISEFVRIPSLNPIFDPEW
jgi:hypothetical protein